MSQPALEVNLHREYFPARWQLLASAHHSSREGHQYLSEESRERRQGIVGEQRSSWMLPNVGFRQYRSSVIQTYNPSPLAVVQNGTPNLKDQEHAIQSPVLV